MADFPHLLAAGRRTTLRRLWSAAGYGTLPGEADGKYDDEGRLILRGSQAVRGYLAAWGIAA